MGMRVQKGADPRTQFKQEHAQQLARQNEADLAYLSMMVDVDIPRGEEQEDRNGQDAED